MDPQETPERRLDGNAVTGPLTELFCVDLSAARATCAGCGGTTALAAHHVYADSPALVVRCPGCTAVVLRYSADARSIRLEMTGARLLVVDRPDPSADDDPAR